uniref:Uncharacterized protein n=1 Tax=Glossina austeni TaxID=7395 RepID=A0A1A9VFK3_GLOAU
MTQQPSAQIIIRYVIPTESPTVSVKNSTNIGGFTDTDQIRGQSCLNGRAREAVKASNLSNTKETTNNRVVIDARVITKCRHTNLSSFEATIISSTLKATIISLFSFVRFNFIFAKPFSTYGVVTLGKSAIANVRLLINKVFQSMLDYNGREQTDILGGTENTATADEKPSEDGASTSNAVVMQFMQQIQQHRQQ